MFKTNIIIKLNYNNHYSNWYKITDHIYNLIIIFVFSMIKITSLYGNDIINVKDLKNIFL